MADLSFDAQKSRILQKPVGLPECSKVTPLVLLLAEKAAIDILKRENCVFSEPLHGLASENAREKAETTGGPQNESADTTVEF